MSALEVIAEFKEAMQDAEAGRFVHMETALYKTPPPHLQ